MDWKSFIITESFNLVYYEGSELDICKKLITFYWMWWHLTLSIQRVTTLYQPVLANKLFMNTHKYYLATASSYVYLSEPWRLCTKALWVMQAKLLELARNSQENKPFLTASGMSTNYHLDNNCFMRIGLEFAPQQMPGTQSQLGGLVGLVEGRLKTRWKSYLRGGWTWDLRPWGQDTTTTPHSTHTYNSWHTSKMLQLTSV